MADIKYCLVNSISLIGRVVTYRQSSGSIAHAVVIEETISGYLLENGDYIRAAVVINVGA